MNDLHQQEALADAAREDLRETILEAAERLYSLAKRLKKKRDTLSEWTVRSVVWELLMLVDGREEKILPEVDRQRCGSALRTASV